jgi:hypothetical protein
MAAAMPGALAVAIMAAMPVPAVTVAITASPIVTFAARTVVVGALPAGTIAAPTLADAGRRDKTADDAPGEEEGRAEKNGTPGVPLCRRRGRRLGRGLGVIVAHDGVALLCFISGPEGRPDMTKLGGGRFGGLSRM